MVHKLSGAAIVHIKIWGKTNYDFYKRTLRTPRDD